MSLLCTFNKLNQRAFFIRCETNKRLLLHWQCIDRKAICAKAQKKKKQIAHFRQFQSRCAQPYYSLKVIKNLIDRMDGITTPCSGCNQNVSNQINMIFLFAAHHMRWALFLCICICRLNWFSNPVCWLNELTP